jgi:hypothetical protein
VVLSFTLSRSAQSSVSWMERIVELDHLTTMTDRLTLE